MDAMSRRRFLAGTPALPSLGILAVAGTGCAPGTSVPTSGTTARPMQPCAGDGTVPIDDVPVSSGFVDFEGWIVTPADRDALIGARRESR